MTEATSATDAIPGYDRPVVEAWLAEKGGGSRPLHPATGP